VRCSLCHNFVVYWKMLSHSQSSNGMRLMTRSTMLPEENTATPTKSKRLAKILIFPRLHIPKME
jgi:hypothetical protein